MEFRQLTIFLEVATTLSFTRAAANLGYVQSNITAQIHALEVELGYPLFDRLGRQVVITDAGVRFRTYAEQIMRLVEESKTLMPEGEAVTGAVRIRMPETLSTYRLPALLYAFKQQYPGVALTLNPTAYEDLRDHLSDGTIDVAFAMTNEINPPHLITEVLWTEPIMVVAQQGHPLSEKTAVTPQDMQKQPLLLTEGWCSYRAMFETQVNAAGVTPSEILEFSSVEAMKQCAIAGLGIAVLPLMAVQPELESGRLSRLDWYDPAFAIQVQMRRHKDKWLSPALEAFCTLAREMFTEPCPAKHTPALPSR